MKKMNILIIFVLCLTTNANKLNTNKARCLLKVMYNSLSNVIIKDDG